MFRVTARALLLATLTAASCANRASAQDHKSIAIESFRRGSAAFQQGDYAGAARAFEESYEHVPRAAAIYNAARSWDAAHDAPRAADDFRVALERTDLAGAEAAEAKRRLAQLEASLGQVDISAPLGWKVFVAHVDGAAAPVKIHVAPGDYAVRGQGPDGRARERTIHVDVQKTVAVELDPSDEGGPAPAAAESSTTSPTLAREPQGGMNVGGLQRTLGFVALGVSAAAAASAIPLGLATLRAKDDFEADPTSERALDEAKDLRTLTNVAWATSAVLAVTGVVLLLTAPSVSRASRVSLGPRSRIVLEARFW